MSSRRALGLLPIGVGLLTSLAFLPALDGKFLNWDDGVNFLLNPHYRGLAWHNVKWMFTTTLGSVYAPLAWLTLGVNYVLGGIDPWGYHFGNLLLHSINAGLFYLVARRLLRATFGAADGGGAALALGAAAAALLFGLHPLRVESVAWVTERRDVLCGLFYLLAVLVHLRGADEGVVRGRWLVGALAAFALALLSKGLAMTLPLTLLVLDVYPLRRGRLGWGRLLAEKAPYLVLAVAAAGAALVAVAKGGATWRGLAEYGFGARVVVTGYNVWFYPWKFVWPHGLSPFYEMPVAIDSLSWGLLGPTGLAAGTTLLLLLARRQCAGLLAAWIHSAIVLAPVSGVVHAGFQLVADRFSYLSGLGFALVAGGGLAWMLRGRRAGRIHGAAGALVVAITLLGLLGLGAATWIQTTRWHDSETLWRAALDVNEDCAACHNNLGTAIVQPGALEMYRLEEAIEHYRRAIALRPRFADAHHNLGVVLAVQKRYDEAEAELRTYRDLVGGAPQGPARLGKFYLEQRRYDEAVPLLRESLQRDASQFVVRANLGRALNALGQDRAVRGDPGGAAQVFREAAEIAPGTLEPVRNLGRLLVERGQAEEAITVLGRGVTIDPRDAPTRFWLARAYLLAGNRIRADAEVTALREIDPGLAARVTADLLR